MADFLSDSGMLPLFIAAGLSFLMLLACVLSMFRPTRENDPLFQHDCL